MIYEEPHRKLKIEQHPPYYKSTNIWQRGQTMIYEAPHRKLKIEQHPPYYKSTNISHLNICTSIKRKNIKL
jgi:hypothetical protein